ncbi:AP2 [Musa troglodytarum]|uniref:AP2 n=1 Tax=Musa troglodytarum TaxID=320322 RepID=A0A9E7EUT0_9LILI|nr:AP2 [Musa troglodytarum]
MTTRYKRVTMGKWGSWVAEVRFPNSRERLWLGSYPTAEQAARAYDAAVYCLRDPGSAFNFPDQPPDIPAAEKLSKEEIRAAASLFAHKRQQRGEDGGGRGARGPWLSQQTMSCRWTTRAQKQCNHQRGGIRRRLGLLLLLFAMIFI